MSNPFVDTIRKAVIQQITAMPNDWHEYHWFSGPGWYFADESEMYVGPYDTRELAQVALYHYCQYLNSPPDTHADEISDAARGHSYEPS